MAGLLLFSTAYQVHPYRFPVIGDMEIYNQLTQEQVMQYYKTRYVPNNLTFIIVGDVDAVSGHPLVQALPREIAPAGIHSHGTAATWPARGAPGICHGAIAPRWRGTSRRLRTRTYPRLICSRRSLVTDAARGFTGGFAKRPVCINRISAFSYTPGYAGLFGIDATVDPKKREGAEQLALQIVDQVKQSGVTADELTKAKKIMLSHHLGALTTMRGQASDVGSDWLLTRDLNQPPLSRRDPESDPRNHIKRVAAQYLTENNLTVISLNPRGSLAAKTEGPKAAAAGEIQKFELSNGLRSLVREDPRLPLVAMGAVFGGGLLAENPPEEWHHPSDGEWLPERHQAADR